MTKEKIMIRGMGISYWFRSPFTIENWDKVWCSCSSEYDETGINEHILVLYV